MIFFKKLNNMERLQKFIEQHEGVWINDGDKNIIINLKFEDALEFTRLHVIAALEEASRTYLSVEQNVSDNPLYLAESIKNAYPLDNIK